MVDFLIAHHERWDVLRTFPDAPLECGFSICISPETIGDPNSIRLAISPLSASYVEVFDGMERIRNYTESGDFKDLDLSGVKVS